MCRKSARYQPLGYLFSLFPFSHNAKSCSSILIYCKYFLCINLLLYFLFLNVYFLYFYFSIMVFIIVYICYFLLQLYSPVFISCTALLLFVSFYFVSVFDFLVLVDLHVFKCNFIMRLLGILIPVYLFFCHVIKL